jgi:hypothetical protein
MAERGVLHGVLLPLLGRVPVCPGVGERRR